jgi:hypothetical protein
MALKSIDLVVDKRRLFRLTSWLHEGRSLLYSLNKGVERYLGQTHPYFVGSAAHLYASAWPSLSNHTVS